MCLKEYTVLDLVGHSMMRIRLNKIQIAIRPQLVGNKGMYNLVAVFDKYTAIIRSGRDVDWKILRNEFFLVQQHTLIL